MHQSTVSRTTPDLASHSQTKDLLHSATELGRSSHVSCPVRHNNDTDEGSGIRRGQTGQLLEAEVLLGRAHNSMRWKVAICNDEL